nr:PREDICTED: perlucin-like [Stegastes partitus]
MERTIFFMFLCIAVEGDIGKHIFVEKQAKWTEAQAYCRQHHTDLSFFNSQSDIDKLQNDVGGTIHNGWIGLQRDPNNYTAWMWSGGGHVTYENWGNGQPNNRNGNQDRASIKSNRKWNDHKSDRLKNFYCIDVTVVEERMSWEDALSHCRENQTDLASVISVTDLLLAQTEIKHNHTERVWIGLRFLGDRWMWMNGDPLEYEVWSQAGDQDHQCPIRKRCGALPKEGLWENWDCEDELNFICM